MVSKEIVMPVDANLAAFYEQASPETRRKVQALFRVVLQELASSDPIPLSELMDSISDRAQARGLTPEILDELLNEHP